MGLQENYILTLASMNTRIGKRGDEEFRKIEIDKNPIEKAEGSARVKIGKTDVLVGVKLGVGEPFSDKEDEGILMTGAELNPLASLDFELGPPREEAIELARVIDRGIRESHAVDLKKLCIRKGEKVWMVFIDINILNHDGNLMDAAGLAAIIALSNTKMLEYKDDKIVYEKKKGDLPLNNKPISITFAKISSPKNNVSKIIVDPSRDEEKAMTGRLTVTTTDKGNVCAMQKGGSSFTLEEIYKAVDIAIKKGQELRKMI
ncbi:MAG: exosome complex protein Rrp42 [Candidatus Aenigmatarchaeota archaeon]